MNLIPLWQKFSHSEDGNQLLQTQKKEEEEEEEEEEGEKNLKTLLGINAERERLMQKRQKLEHRLQEVHTEMCELDTKLMHTVSEIL
jgi:uncharacterized protein YlxW (UPF0749 family)